MARAAIDDHGRPASPSPAGTTWYDCSADGTRTYRVVTDGYGQSGSLAPDRPVLELPASELLMSVRMLLRRTFAGALRALRTRRRGEPEGLIPAFDPTVPTATARYGNRPTTAGED
jgi:hypothetical protein